MTDIAPPWLSEGRPAWQDAISGWIAEKLPPTSFTLDSVKERPWGAVLRVITPSKNFICKAVGVRGQHEMRVLADLAAYPGKLVPDVIATDLDRGWMLMEDHGVAMVDVADVAQQAKLVERLLPSYAELQIASAERVDGWTEHGVPDRSPPLLPALLSDLLAGSSPIGRLPLDTREVAGMLENVDLFARVCDELAEPSVPRAIDHADIHGTNVLVDGGEDPRLVDWGDSCITHPFASLLVPVEWIAGRMPAADRTRAVHRLRDAYLEPWGARATPDLVGRAVCAGYVIRAVSNAEQSFGGSAADVADAQREIVALLRAWKSKAGALDDPEALLRPAIPW